MNITSIGNFRDIGILRSFRQVRRDFGLRELYQGVGLATVALT